jgi:hypothetical protein
MAGELLKKRALFFKSSAGFARKLSKLRRL